MLVWPDPSRGSGWMGGWEVSWGKRRWEWLPIPSHNLCLRLPSSPDAAFYRERGLSDIKRALKAPRFEGQAKNIIYFVGDGLGVSTHTMSRIYKGQKKGRTGEEESLVWEDWDYSGLIKVSLLRPNQFTEKCCGFFWELDPSWKAFRQNLCKLSAPNVTNCETQGQWVISFNNLEEQIIKWPATIKNLPFFIPHSEPEFQVPQLFLILADNQFFKFQSDATAVFSKTCQNYTHTLHCFSYPGLFLVEMS